MSQNNQSAAPDLTQNSQPLSIQEAYQGCNTEIKLVLQKYCELSIQADEFEIAALNDLNNLQHSLSNYQTFLRSKLNFYKERILMFSKNVQDKMLGSN